METNQVIFFTIFSFLILWVFIISVKSSRTEVKDGLSVVLVFSIAVLMIMVIKSTEELNSLKKKNSCKEYEKVEIELYRLKHHGK